MILMFLFIHIPPNLFSRALGTVPRDLNTLGLTITFMFHNFFSSLARLTYWSSFFFFSLSFIFILWSARMAKSTWWQVLFLLIVVFGLAFVPESHREFYASLFLGLILVFAYSICQILRFFHKFQRVVVLMA